MGNPFRWWWRRQAKRPPHLLAAVAYTALGVGYLATGSRATIGYLWIGAGALWFGVSIAAWVYQRRHPLPPKHSWLDDALG